MKNSNNRENGVRAPRLAGSHMEQEMSKSNDAAELIELTNTGHQGVKRTLTDLGYTTEQVAQLEAIAATPISIIQIATK